MFYLPTYTRFLIWTSCKSTSPKKTSSAAEISSEEKSDPSKKINPDQDSTRRPKPSNPSHSTTKQLDSRTDSKRSSVPDIRTQSAELRRTSTPVAVAPPSEQRRQPVAVAPPSERRQPFKGQKQGQAQGQARRLNENPSGNVRLVKRSDVRPSSASPSLTRASRAFRSSGDLLAASSKTQRFSTPREERSPSKTGSTSSVERAGLGGARVRSSAVGSVKSQDNAMRRSKSMDSAKLLQLAGGKVGSRPLTAAGSHGGLQDRARRSNPKVVAGGVASRSGADNKRRIDPWKKNQMRRSSSGSPAQGLNSGVRLGLAGDRRLLPGGRTRRGPNDDMRSSSVDASPTDDSKSLPGGEGDRDGRVRSASLQPSASLTLLRIDGYISGLPSPEDDDDLNARMELVYEQYRDYQLGVTSGEFKGFGGKKTSSQGQRDRIGSRRSDSVVPHHHPRKDGVVAPSSKVSSPGTARRLADRPATSGKEGNIRSLDRVGISSRGGSPETHGRGGINRADCHNTANRNLYKSLGDISADISDKDFVIMTTEQNTPDTDDAVGSDSRAKPRKDDRLGPPTRIPLPVGAPGELRVNCEQSPTSSSLTRFDSGVDITNLSPTGDNGSFSIVDTYSTASTCHHHRPSLGGGQCTEACSLSEQKLAYVAPPTVSEEEFY